MKIIVTSVFVNDQAAALAFYTDVLGFAKKTDIPTGEYRWLTVTSPEAPDGVELLLEPNVTPVAQTYQTALHEAGIAAAMFGVDDIEAETARLKGEGVEFTMEPTDIGGPIMAVFDDTCGNLIQIVQS